MNGSAARSDDPATAHPGGAQEDPLRAVRRLGQRASRDGIYVGLIIALLSHFSAYAAPEYTLWQMRNVVDKMHGQLHDFFVVAYDVEVLDEEEPPVEEEEALAEDDEAEVEEEEVVEDEDEKVEQTQEEYVPDQTEPDQTDDAEEDDSPYPDEEAPPDTAEAPDVLTAPESGPVDLTERFTFTDKDGSKSTGGGLTSGKGKAKKPVRNPNARSGGKGRRTSKGKGKGRRKRRGRGVNRSRGLGGSYRASCPFPPQADLHQVDKATVVLSVTVAPSGRVTNASVISDPGYGFGAAARRCVLAQPFPPALDEDGNPIAKTGTLNYRFTR
ncbi:MAG TPA: TonB family protein [Polyangiaceae bacterium]|nr:TonB family protein [Polyangiaceae bacterium]